MKWTKLTCGMLALGPAASLSPWGFATGGDTCATATVIPSLPYETVGGTCDANHDYSSGCLGAEDGRDVVYAYTAPRDGAFSVSACVATLTSKIYVFRDSCSPGSLVACSSPICIDPVSLQVRPIIESVQMMAGSTYYIVVDSTSGVTCVESFELSMVELACDVCPPDAEPENEPNCGLDDRGLPSDTVNGGCASELELFTPIVHGQIVCATTAGNSTTDARDTDWYELSLDHPALVVWSVAAEGSLRVATLDNDGDRDCSLLECFGEIRDTTACLTTSIVEYLPAGTGWLFVAPSPGAAVDCGTQYSVRVFVIEITPDINGDGVVNGIDLGILLSWWTIAPGVPVCPGDDDPCPGDLNIDGLVNGVDLGILLADWTIG